MRPKIVVESRVLDRRALGLSEAAGAYGVSRMMLWRMVQRGELQSYKIGRRRLLPVESLEARFRPDPVADYPALNGLAQQQKAA